MRTAASFGFPVFALALALATGAVSRRTVPAVLVPVGVFFVAQVAIGNGLRQSYLPPMERTVAPYARSLSGQSEDREWLLDGYARDGAGNRLRNRQLNEMCATVGKRDFASCLESHGVRLVGRFHPADRFWTFQAIEAAIYLGMAAPLLGVTVWGVRRRMR